MSALVWVGVALIGGVGAVARFVVTEGVTARLRRSFPYGTLVVNVSGALLLGVFAGLAFGRDAALLAGTAFVGAYTTFSTWLLETQRLTEEGRGRAALGNVLISLALGLGAAALGRFVARQF